MSVYLSLCVYSHCLHGTDDTDISFSVDLSFYLICLLLFFFPKPKNKMKTKKEIPQYNFPIWFLCGFSNHLTFLVERYNKSIALTETPYRFMHSISVNIHIVTDRERILWIRSLLEYRKHLLFEDTHTYIHTHHIYPANRVVCSVMQASAFFF